MEDAPPKECQAEEAGQALADVINEWGNLLGKLMVEAHDLLRTKVDHLTDLAIENEVKRELALRCPADMLQDLTHRVEAMEINLSRLLHHHGLDCVTARQIWEGEWMAEPTGFHEAIAETRDSEDAEAMGGLPDSE